MATQAQCDRTLKSLRQLGNVARHYQIKQVNRFQGDRPNTHYHEGWQTHSALTQLMREGVVGRHQVTPRETYYYIKP